MFPGKRLVRPGLLAGVAAAVPGLAFAAVVDVTLTNFQFTPSTVVVQEGDVVRWTNNASFPSHTVTSGTACTFDGQWNSGFLVLDDVFTQTFDAAGTFPYFCIPHCLIEMTGTVIVESPTGIGDTPVPNFELHQNYPNPFNPSTTIRYTVKRRSRVTIQIFNARGIVVRSFEREIDRPGVHSVLWDGSDERGTPQASGIYFYQMKVGGLAVDMKKMVLLK